tara:strand:- start:131 stop:793 length:663 start_codon:yes stop_codon:yes gene_type:complete
VKKKLKKLEDRISYAFKNKDLLLTAFTHKSSNPEDNYEKLEFLGDRVLGIVISKKLLELYPDEKVGSLDKKFASLVNKDRCLEIGKSLKIENFINVGKKNTKTIKIENKIISDCCEALIGAILLDSNLDQAKKFILKNWAPHLISSFENVVDAKTELQEYSLKMFKMLPVYKLISNTGPRHKPTFKVGVKIKNTSFIYSTGSSKQKAEQSAATELLRSLK